MAATVLEDSDQHQAIQALRGARHVTAICHQNPDTDTVGAAIAVALIAERLGAQAEVVSADALPPSCSFLPRAEQVHRTPHLPPDLAVVCDSATLQRAGDLLLDRLDWLAGARILNVDHHVSNTRWGHLNLVDPTAAATCEVIAGLLPGLGVEPDVELATALLAGIVRDSQGLTDLATSPRTLRVVARLVEAGASLPDTQRRVVGELPYPTMLLWGRLLSGVAQAGGGRIVHATLTLDMLADTGTQQHDADGLVEFLARTRGALVTILFRELAASQTRVSLRTVDGVDAIELARPFNGGGHARRAGWVANEPVDAVRDRLLGLCETTLGAR